MKARIFLLFVLILCVLTFGAHAQVVISGHVTDAKASVPLYPATVLDATTGLATSADSSGYYRIEVNPGDVLLFKYIGFYTEKYEVPQRLEYIIHNVKLLSKRVKLKTLDVTALTPYQQDSLERVETVGYYLSLPVVHLVDFNGMGVTMHPLTYFSKAERRKRKFHKRYKSFEKNAFIDSRYKAPLVHRLTGLVKDSLRLFMFHHRPPYAFTRYASKLELWSWIIRNCRKWRDSLQTVKPK